MPARIAAAAAAKRRQQEQRWPPQQRRTRSPPPAAAALLPPLLLLLLAAASTASASPPADDVNLLPTESEAFASGLGYAPSTDPSGMILLPRPLAALPPPARLAEAGLAVLAGQLGSSTAQSDAERAESDELQQQEEQRLDAKSGGSSRSATTNVGGWAMAAIVGAGRRAAAALVLPRPVLGAASSGARLAAPPREEEAAAAGDAAAPHEDDGNTDDGIAARRDAFAAAVRADLRAALLDARRAFPDGDFPAPVAAAAAARVLSARTPHELRSRTAALGEAKRRLLAYSVGGSFSSPCGPSCAPGACLPEVSPYTYAQTGSPGYVPGPFTGTGGLAYLKHYNGNGVIGLYSCRRCVNDCYEQVPYPNTNVQMCVCKAGCGIVRGAFVPVCSLNGQGDWVRDEQVRIRNGEAGAYRGSVLDIPIPLASGRASEGIVVTAGERAAVAKALAEQAQGSSAAAARGGRGGGGGGGGAGGRSLLYLRSKQQFAAAAGCNYVRQNYCRRCPINYFQQTGNLTHAVCAPCPFDRPTTAGMTGSPTCFVACDPALAATYGVDDPARPIYTYTREDCDAAIDAFDAGDDPLEGVVLNEVYPELFPPFSSFGDAAAAAAARDAGAGGGGGKGGVGGGGGNGRSGGGKRRWDPFSYDGPPMPIRVPRSRWIQAARQPQQEEDGQGEGAGDGGAGAAAAVEGGGEG